MMVHLHAAYNLLVTNVLELGLSKASCVKLSCRHDTTSAFACTWHVWSEVWLVLLNAVQWPSCSWASN